MKKKKRSEYTRQRERILKVYLRIRKKGYKILEDIYLPTTKELLKEVYHKLDDLTVTEEDLTRLKKVLIAQEIKQADYVDGVTASITHDLIKYNKLVENPIEIYKSLNIDELNKVLKGISYKNRAVVTYVPKNMPKFQES